jgi:integrase
MAKKLIPGDATIKAVKPGDPRARLNDGEGLYLLLFVKGGAHGWRFDYSVGGRRKTLSLGTYPDTSLTLARKKADEYRKLVAEGTDPSETRKAGKMAQRAQFEAQARADDGLPPIGSFEAVAREWVETIHQATVSAPHAERTLIRFEKDVFPWVGRTPLAELGAPELLTLLRRVEARGAIETAHRIKDACGQVFRYGIATGQCTRDPAADLRGALKPVNTKHMATVTEPKRVGQLMRLIDDYNGFPTTRAALQLAPLLFQRPGNLRAMEWAELDLDAAVWTIPAAKMKRSISDKTNGAAHVVPLARQAVAILRDIAPLTGQGRYVFPSEHDAERRAAAHGYRHTHRPDHARLSRDGAHDAGRAAGRARADHRSAVGAHGQGLFGPGLQPHAVCRAAQGADAAMGRLPGHAAQGRRRADVHQEGVIDRFRRA